MSIPAATAQTVTTASGTVAIATTSTSLGVAKVMAEAPTDAQQLAEVAQYVITTADKIGLFSATIMLLSFTYTVYSSRRKRSIDLAKVELDGQFYQLRLGEYELEKAKYLGNPVKLKTPTPTGE